MQNNSPFASPDLGFREAIKIALKPPLLMRSIFTSAIIWLLVTTAMSSYAELIFHGQMADYFAAGLGITLVSQIVLLIVTSLFSSDHATLVIPQSPTAVIQGMIASSLVAAAPADMSPEALFPLVYWIIALSSLLTGGFVLLLGLTRAAGLVRYIPYPIVGGFLAGLGWVIFNAGFAVVVDLRVSAQTLPILLEDGVVMRWLPALVFASCTLLLQARYRNMMIMPVMILVAVTLFHAWAHLVVGDVAALAAAGWFLPGVPEPINWQPLDLTAIAWIDADMIGASAGGILTLLIVCALNVFFRASAQELISGRELDLNRESAVNGAANMASGLVGGIVGYHGTLSSALVEMTGVYGRLVGIILALMFWLTLMFGSALFSLMPRFLPAGLLMFFGLQFMKDWLLDSWFKLPRQDYVIVVVIALATALFGLLPGIGLGMVLAMSFFVLEYSRMDVIKQQLSGSVHRSNLDRSFAENRFLQREGKKILILRLQGYLFFGTAYRFYEHVKLIISDEAVDPLRYIALDFKSVRGFDASTVSDFKKLKQLSDRHGIELLFSSVLPHLQPLLAGGGILERESGGPLFFDDLDHALEWCENALLDGAALFGATVVTVEQQLAQHALIDNRDVSALYRYLERVETSAGDVVVRQGDESDALYFIESGRVDVLLQGDGPDVLRLRSMTAGAIIGEVGFYLKKARTASIVVTEAGVLQRLSLKALQAMKATDPHTASALHMFITCVLSERLSNSNRVIQELID